MLNYTEVVIFARINGKLINSNQISWTLKHEGAFKGVLGFIKTALTDTEL